MSELIEFNNLQQTLAEYADDIVFNYKESLSINERRATGQLITSIHSTVSVNQTVFTIELSLEDYWVYVEEGTKPHMPPVNKILEWVKVKPVLPQPINGKLPTQESLAWAIAKKIERVGTEGSFDLKDTMEKTKDYWEERISDALDRDIAEMFTKLFVF